MTMTYKTFTMILFLILSLCLNLYSQVDTTGHRFVDNLAQLSARFTQAKLYLHTDREHYEACDSTLFRAYVVNAKSKNLALLVKFVYV